jgi:hypothetical protein
MRRTIIEKSVGSVVSGVESVDERNGKDKPWHAMHTSNIHMSMPLSNQILLLMGPFSVRNVLIVGTTNLFNIFRTTTIHMGSPK